MISIKCLCLRTKCLKCSLDFELYNFRVKIINFEQYAYKLLFWINCLKMIQYIYQMNNNFLLYKKNNVLFPLFSSSLFLSLSFFIFSQNKLLNMYTLSDWSCFKYLWIATLELLSPICTAMNLIQFVYAFKYLHFFILWYSQFYFSL